VEFKKGGKVPDRGRITVDSFKIVCKHTFSFRRAGLVGLLQIQWDKNSPAEWSADC